MKTAEQIKETVKEKYSIIVEADKGTDCGCGSGMCCGGENNVFYNDYSKLEGYNPDAELFLGCGLPTEDAQISEGDRVLDLGSGAGNDAFIARRIVGETGKVIGVDMTEAMVDKANENNAKLGYKNLDFRLGEIESLPVKDEEVNVIISNCVLNLVPDKAKAFAEMYRVTEKGGHFCVSDIVVNGTLPEELSEATEMYIGCVSGAISKDEYIQKIKDAGFTNIEIKKEKEYVLSDDILKDFLNEEQIASYKASNAEIYSITVFGEKN
jgi:arsenite methyltransferase